MNCNIMHMSPSVILIVLLYKKMTKGYCLLLYSDKAAGLFFFKFSDLNQNISKSKLQVCSGLWCDAAVITCK